jgi:O-antigen/teichoic acid export membrane protein
VFRKVSDSMKIMEFINSKLVLSAAIYTISNLINKAIPFLLLPILTRFLSPEDYGIVSMFGVLVSFIIPFTGLNVHGAISRMYYEQESIDIKEYITNCIYVLLFSSSIVAIVFMVSSKLIERITSVPYEILWIVILVSISQFITTIVLTLWQVQVKPLKFGIFQISQTLLNMILSILFVVFIGLTWKGSIYAQVISVSIFAIIGLAILKKNDWLKNKINLSYIKHALSFGLPLVPHTLGGVIMTMTDRVFITNMVGIDATGIYTVGYQVGMLISLLATSFNQAYVPWLYSKLKENIYNTKVKIVKFTYIYNIAIFLLAILLSIVAPKFLSFFVGDKFDNASIYVTWVALGYAFNGMYLMVTNYIFYAQKTSYLATVTFITAIINIPLNYIMIKNFGAVGAAQATTMIYFIKFILTWILSSVTYKMPWNIFKDSGLEHK